MTLKCYDVHFLRPGTPLRYQRFEEIMMHDCDDENQIKTIPCYSQYSIWTIAPKVKIVIGDDQFQSISHYVFQDFYKDIVAGDQFALFCILQDLTFLLGFYVSQIVKRW